PHGRLPGSVGARHAGDRTKAFCVPWPALLGLASFTHVWFWWRGRNRDRGMSSAECSIIQLLWCVQPKERLLTAPRTLRSSPGAVAACKVGAGCSAVSWVRFISAEDILRPRLRPSFASVPCVNDADGRTCLRSFSRAFVCRPHGGLLRAHDADAASHRTRAVPVAAGCLWGK